MNRIDRLFGILTLLQSKKFVPAEKIADKFDLSIRTVYRDIKALCEQGIPISFEQGRGYFIVPGYFLPPVSFTTEEANAFLLMETLVQGFADRSIQKHYSSALNKVKAVMHVSEKEKAELLTQHMKLQVPARLRLDFEFLSVIQHCIASKTIMAIEYNNLKGESSQRETEPIGLVFYAFSWHVIAWCLLRKEYRDFKVARIVKVKDTNQPFTQPSHRELADYMKELPVDF